LGVGMGYDSLDNLALLISLCKRSSLLIKKYRPGDHVSTYPSAPIFYRLLILELSLNGFPLPDGRLVLHSSNHDDSDCIGTATIDLNFVTRLTPNHPPLFFL